MTQFTQQAIIDTFLKLLNTLPLNQITIQMIADECGISRNTFYYHFGDIYALIDTIFQQMLEKSWEESKQSNTRLEAIRANLSAFSENRQAFFNLYDSINLQLITKYVYNITADYVYNHIKTSVGSDPVSEEDLKMITFMYQSLILGFILDWLSQGLKGDPSENLERAERLFLEGVHLVLEKNNAQGLKKIS